MAAFVADASATLPWCFEDEATAWTESLLDRLRGGDRMVVPAHWPAEVSNSMLTAMRKRRIQQWRSEQFWDDLAGLHVTVEPPLTPDQAKAVVDLCTQYGLTVYDGIYLQLAKRTELALATLDKDLLRAAPLAGVTLAR